MNRKRTAAWCIGALSFGVSVLLALVGICTLMLKPVYTIMRSAREFLQQTALRVWTLCRKFSTQPCLACITIPFAMALIILAFGVCCTPDHEEGRFIPRREEPGCPCCHAVLVHRCIHELGEWRHVFQYECMPVLERLADKLQAIEPPSPQP